MKRLATLALLVCLAAAPIFAEEKEPGGLEVWKWANFVVLAGALGYLIGKKGGPFEALGGQLAGPFRGLIPPAQHLLQRLEKDAL